MPEVNRRWVFPTVTASQNKGIERIALSGEGTAHEVVGVDGSRRFGCRPTSGFRLAHTFDIYKDFSGANARPFSSVAPPTQAKTSTVTDCFPVHFQIKENEFGHGFVYRVKKNNVATANSAIYLDYVPTTATVDYTGVAAATGWRTVLLSDHSAGAGGHVNSDDKMDVVSMGRYIFTFVQGRTPRVFYIESDGASTPVYTSKVVDGGPGKSPKEDTTIAAAAGSVDPPAFNLLAFDANDTWAGANTGHAFAEGEYSFAYYLYNDLTGRRTPLSEVITGTQGAGTSKKKLRFNADTTKFNQIYLFRSVRLQSVGGTYAGAILHLDGIYDFSSTTPVNNDGPYMHQVDADASPYDGNFDCFELYYQLDDIALAMQDVYLDRVSYDQEMPNAASGVAFEGSLIVSDPTGPTDAIPEGPYQLASATQRERNIGEIRWSSLTERSPELFPINNKYSPDVFQNRVQKLMRSGDFAIGFSSDRLYHIRRNGIYLRIEDLHEGYGLSGFNAVANAGPMIYFVTNKGLKAIANNGQLDDIKTLDNLLLEDWYEDLSLIRMSFDPYSGCLFILNPVKEQTVCMWFGTGRVTEIHDAVFDDVRTGIWPKDFSRNPYDDTSPTPTTTTTMVERAFFLQNHPAASDASSVHANWKPRAYILDMDRDKVQINSNDIAVGQPRLRTLDCGGDSIFKIASITDNGTNRTINLKRLSTTAQNVGGGGLGNPDLVGAYAYVLTAAKATEVGKKYQIYGGTAGSVSVDGSGGGNGQIIVEDNGDLNNLAAGDVISIGPVLTRYVGGALPMIRSKDNQIISSFDLFQNKQISSLGCHFADVTGGVTGYKFFRGLVFNTESDSAAVSAFPRDFSGTIIGDSIKTGESEDYAAFTSTGTQTTGRHGIQDSALNPGVEFFVPDLDYKLMALICRGRTTGTDTGERNAT